MSRSLALSAVTVLLISASLAPSPSLAQKTTLAPGQARVSNEPRVIVQQIQQAIEQEKKALAAYEVIGPEDSVEVAHQAASNAYVLIRSAKDGIASIKARKKYPDPVLDLVHQKMVAAWNRSRSPVDKVAAPGKGRVVYVQTSIRQINETIVMLDQVLLMWP